MNVFSIAAFLFYGVGFTILSLLAALLMTAYLTRRPPRAEAHWTERARWNWSKMIYSSLWLFLVAGVAAGIAFVTGSIFVNPVSLAIVVYLLSFLTCRYFVRRFIRKRLKSREPVGQSRHTLMMYGHLIPVATAAIIMPDLFGWHAALINLVGFGGMVWMFRNAIFVARKTGLVVDSDYETKMIVESVAEELNAPMPELFTEHVWFANAYAIFARHQMLFTDHALRLLNREEKRSIAAHEMGHLLERTTTKFRRFAGLSITIPLMNVHPLSTLGSWYVIGAFAIVLIFVLIVRRRSQDLEEEADEVAHGLEQDSAIYARALEKLYAFNLSPAVTAKKIKTHPDLYDRMVDAGVTPDWPKPAPPRRHRLIVLWAFPYAFCLMLFALAGPRVVDRELGLWINGQKQDVAHFATDSIESDPELAREYALVLVDDEDPFYRERGFTILVALGACLQVRSETSPYDLDIEEAIAIRCGSFGPND